MANSLELTSEVHDKLWGHLLQGDQQQVAFIFAHAVEGGDGVVFRGREVYLVRAHDLLVQASYHVSLTDEIQATIIKMAWEKGLALVEFHSHPRGTGPAQFSASDLSGLYEFVPHVRWRLKGQPYLAIVVGSSDFDGLVWRKGSPEDLDHMLVGDRIVWPTGLTLEARRRRPSKADGRISFS